MNIRSPEFGTNVYMLKSEDAVQLCIKLLVSLMLVFFAADIRCSVHQSVAARFSSVYNLNPDVI